MSPHPATAPSLEGRRFAAVVTDDDGDVTNDTIFEYHQTEDLVWARYGGGPIRLGFLVGTRVGNVISFRYSQVTTDGYTANGYCMSRIVELADGTLECHEEWQWENRTGSGTSIIRELRS